MRAWAVKDGKVVYEITSDEAFMLMHVAAEIEDEGDRCYLDSTNHADQLKDLANRLADEALETADIEDAEISDDQDDASDENLDCGWGGVHDD